MGPHLKVLFVVIRERYLGDVELNLYLSNSVVRWIGYDDARALAFLLEVLLHHLARSIHGHTRSSVSLAA